MPDSNINPIEQNRITVNRLATATVIVLIVSAVALCILQGLASSALVALSPYALYIPPASLFLAGTVLAIVTVIKNLAKEKLPQPPAPHPIPVPLPDPIPKPAPIPAPFPEPHPHVDPHPFPIPDPRPHLNPPRPLPAPPKRDLEAVFSYDPPSADLPALKEDPSTTDLDPIGFPESSSVLFLLMGDSMNPKLESPHNATLSLSSLLLALRALQNEKTESGQPINLVNPEILQSTIDLLSNSFNCAYWIRDLSNPPHGRQNSRELYNQRREQVVHKIVEILENQGRVVIPSGYYDDEKKGHILLTELLYDAATGMVQGRILNLGEGSNYHSSDNADQTKVTSRFLPPLALNQLKRSPFLRYLINLQNSEKFKEDQELGLNAQYGFTIDDYYTVLKSWNGELPPKTPPPKAYSHSEQQSGSCSMKPFIAWIKEEFLAGQRGEKGRQDGIVTKLYCEIRAIEQFLDQLEARNLADRASSLEDIRAVDDCFAHMSTTATKFIRENGRLPDALTDKLQLLNLRASHILSEANQKFKEKVRNKEVRLGEEVQRRRSPDLPFPYRWVIGRDHPARNLYLYRKELDLATYLSNMNSRLSFLASLEDQHLEENYQWANDILKSLPPVSDKEFWQRQKLSLKSVSDLFKIIFEAPQSKANRIPYSPQAPSPLNILPERALLNLKGMIILLYVTENWGLDPVVLNKYRSQIKFAFDKTAPNYRFTHPDEVRLFQECQFYFRDVAAAHELDYYQVFKEGSCTALLENTLLKEERDLEHNPECQFLQALIRDCPNVLPWIPPTLLLDKTFKEATYIERFRKLYEDFNRVANNSIVVPDSSDAHYRALLANHQFELWHVLRNYFQLFLASDYYVSNKTSGFYFSYTVNYYKNGDYHVMGAHENTFHDKEESRFLFSETFRRIDEMPNAADRRIEKRALLLSILNNKDSLAGKSKTIQNEQLRHQEGSFELNLPKEEFQELLSIASGETLKVPQLVLFFQRHILRLKEPFFQNLFCHFLFSLASDGTPFLTKLFNNKKASLIKKQFFSFLFSGLDYAKERRHHDLFSFFLRVAFQSLRFLAETPKNKKLLEESIKKLSETIRTLTPDEHKEELNSLVSAVRYCEHVPSLAPLLALIESAKDRVQAMPRDANFPLEQADYDRACFVLREQERAGNSLPARIVNGEDFKKFFPAQFVAEKREDGFFYLRDKGNNECRIKLEGPYNFFIERSFRFKGEGDPQWYRRTARPANFWASSGIGEEQSSCFKDCDYWHFQQAGENAAVFTALDRNGLSNVAAFVSQNEIHHPSDPRLTLTRFISPNLQESLTRLTPHFLVWKDEGGASRRIEMPERHLPASPTSPLSFNWIDGKWFSSAHQGFYLSPKIDSPTLCPYSNYLILENAGGGKMALVSDLTLTFAPQVPFPQRRAEPVAKENLYLFQLNTENEIILPQKKEDLLFLLYIALAKGDYDYAVRIISVLEIEHPSANLWEERFDTKKRLDPRFSALLLRIILTAIGKKEGTSPPPETIDFHYNRYITLSHHLPPSFRLSPEKERSIFDNVKPRKNLDLRFSFREKFLDHKPQFQYDLAREESMSVGQNVLDIRELYNLPAPMQEKMRAGFRTPFSPTLFYNLRPGEDFIRNFFHCYQIATESRPDDPRREELRQFLLCARKSRDNTIVVLLKTLAYALLYPEKIPRFSVDPLPPLPSAEKILSKENLLESLRSIWDTTNEYRWCDLFNLLNQGPHFSYDIEEHYLPHKEALLATPHFTPKPSPADLRLQGALAPRAPSPIPLPIPELAKGENLLDRLKEFGIITIPEDRLADRPEVATLGILGRALTPLAERARAAGDGGYAHELNKVVQGAAKKIEQLNADRTIYELHFDQARLRALTAHLNHRRAEHQDLLDKILLEANAFPDLARAFPLSLEQYGHLFQPLTIDQMLLAFVRGSDEDFYRANPSLNPERLAALKELIGNYLILSTDIGHEERIANLFRDILNAVGPKKAALETSFLQMARSERVYNPQAEPLLLLFEHHNQIRLYPEQYEALTKLHNGENMEFEARTGFGKSKTLIPLFLSFNALKSLARRAPLMVVPSALFPAMLETLRDLGRRFKLTIDPLQFDRRSANDPAFLEDLLARLQSAQNGDRILLTSIHSLHGMLSLKIKELLAAPLTVLSRRLISTLYEIRKVLTSMRGMIDESDLCLDSHIFFDFSIGKPEPVEKERLDAPIFLYRHIIKARFPLEFLPNPEKRSLKKDSDYNEIREHLVDVLIEPLCQQFRIPPMQAGNIRALLLNQKVSLEFLDELSPKAQEELDRVHAEINIHLSRTLFRPCQDGYDLPGDQSSANSQKKVYNLNEERVAVPCHLGIPRPTSEFSSIEDQINFTIQANLKIPFSFPTIKALFDEIKDKISGAGGLEEALRNNPPYQFFVRHVLKFKGLDEGEFYRIDDRYLQRELQNLNEDLFLKLEFIKQFVLPKIKYYKEKVASNAFTLLPSFPDIHGVSGTISPETLPEKMTSCPDETAIMDNLAVLLSPTNRQPPLLMRGNNPEEQLTSLLQASPQSSVLIDVAGSFRELTQERIAEIILQRRVGIQGVVYFDVRGEEMIWEKGSKIPRLREESRIPYSQLFVFIRKSKVIGTDLKLEPTTEAILTFSSSTPRNLLLQGAGRMRQLKLGQKIHLACEESDNKAIFETEEGTALLHQSQGNYFLPLLANALKIQGQQKGEESFHTIALFAKSQAEQIFWSSLSQQRFVTPDDLKAIFENYRTFLVEASQLNALAHIRTRYGQLPQKEAIAQVGSGYYDKDHGLITRLLLKLRKPQLLPVLAKEFGDYIESRKQYLPAQIFGQNGLGVSESEAEVQAEAQAEQEMQVEVEAEDQREVAAAREIPFDDFIATPPTPWNEALYACPKAFDLLGIPVHFSPNFDKVSVSPAENQLVQKPAYQTLVYLTSEGEYHFVLLDQHDAIEMLSRIENQEEYPQDDPKHLVNNTYLFSGSTCIAEWTPRGKLEPTQEMALRLTLIRKLYLPPASLKTDEKLYFERHLDEAYAFYKLLTHLIHFWPKQRTFKDQIEAILRENPSIDRDLSFHGRAAQENERNFHRFLNQISDIPLKPSISRQRFR